MYVPQRIFLEMTAVVGPRYCCHAIKVRDRATVALTLLGEDDAGDGAEGLEESAGAGAEETKGDAPFAVASHGGVDKSPL